MQNSTIEVVWEGGVGVRLVNKWVGLEIFEIYERDMSMVGVRGKIFETFINI